jgi:hypothetical protein
MEFKSISSKLPRDEVTRLRAYCEKKGITPSALIRELILRELEIPMPHHVAGKNRIEYNKESDDFTWAVNLDNGDDFMVLEKVTVGFIEDLNSVISRAIDERSAFIGKENEDSITVPSRFLRSGEDKIKK